MAWQTPKTDWTASDSPTPSALNRIEGNILELKKAATIDVEDAAGNFTATDVEGVLQELAGNVTTGKTAVASAIYAMGQQADGSMTFAELAAKIQNISKDATAAVGEVLSSKTFYAGGSKKTGTMPNRGAVVITPGTSNKAIPSGYHNGSGYVVGDADLVAANIRAGKDLFGVAGNFTADANAGAADILENKTAYVNGNKITGSMTNQGVKTITPGTSDQALSGFYAAGSKVAGDSDLIAENIVRGKNIFGVEGSAITSNLIKYSRYTYPGSSLFDGVNYSGNAIFMSPQGNYCVLGSNGFVVDMYKRNPNDTWSKVFTSNEYLIRSGSWTPDENYLLAGVYDSNSVNGIVLFKRMGDTLLEVARITASSEVSDISRWDSMGAYCVAYRNNTVDDQLIHPLKG